MNLIEELNKRQKQRENGRIVPACGGTEQPIQYGHYRWLYVYQPSSGRHGWLCMDTDIVEWDRNFNPFEKRS